MKRITLSYSRLMSNLKNKPPNYYLLNYCTVTIFCKHEYDNTLWTYAFYADMYLWGVKIDLLLIFFHITAPETHVFDTNMKLGATYHAESFNLCFLQHIYNILYHLKTAKILMFIYDCVIVIYYLGKILQSATSRLVCYRHIPNDISVFSNRNTSAISTKYLFI